MLARAPHGDKRAGFGWRKGEKRMKQYITKSLHIERVTLIGPAFESQAAFKWLNENGYWPVRSGPYHDANMFPCVDVDRFLIVAERQIEPALGLGVKEESDERTNTATEMR